MQIAALALAAQVGQTVPMDPFAPKQDLTIDVRRIGESAEPLLVIDDFLADPSAAVEAACQADWRELPVGGYPGKRAALPRAYVGAVLRRIDAPVRQVLLNRSARLEKFNCSFSMVTCAPGQLTPLQRVPHIDIARESRVAILHYLCGAKFGGTAFFRQAATGLEQIHPEDRVRYVEARARGLGELKLEDHYPSAGTPGYQRTAFVEARFNRLVAYRSFTLHSGIVEDPAILSDDPEIGRVTANFFVDYSIV